MSAQTGNVIGKLVDPEGITGIASATVYIHDASWATYKSTTTDSNGNFTFYDLSPATYTIEVYPAWPWTKDYSAPKPFSVAVEADKTTDLSKIKFKKDNIRGKILDSDGKAMTSFYVSASSTNYTNYSYAYKYTDSDGNFSMYLPDTGTYTLYGYDDSSKGFFWPGNKSFELTATEQALDLGTFQGKTPNVKGKFTDKNGSVIPSYYYPYAYLYKSNWSESKYANVDRTTGEFKFYASSGTWTLSLYGGGNGGQDPDPVSVTVPETGVTDLGTIRQTAPNVTFSLVEPNGTTAVTSGGWAYLHTADWSVYKYANFNSSGQVEFTLTQSATYTLEAYSNSSTYADPDPYTFTFSSGGTVSQTLTMQQPAMRGKVVDPSGNGLAYVYLNVHDANWSSNGYGWASTDSSGNFTVRKALATGTYTVNLSYYNWNGGAQYVMPDDFEISLVKGTTDTTYVTTPLVATTPVKTINVSVKYPNGNAVTDGYISGWKTGSGSGWFSGQTNSSGQYSITTSSGTWNVSAYPVWTGGSPAWGFFESAKVVKFEEARDVPETQSVEITVVPFTSVIKGEVLNPDGSVPSTSDYTSVSIYQDGGAYNWTQLGSDGSFSVRVPKGTHKVQVYTSSTTKGSPDLQSWSVGEDETLDIGTLYLVEKKEKIVVTIVDANGNALADQYAYAWKDNGNYGWASGQTDSTGKVTLNVTKGDWVVYTYANYWYGGATTQYVPIESSKKVSVSAEETKNVSFTFAVANATIIGSVQDSDGNTVSGYGWISVRSSSSTDVWGSGLGCSVSQGAFICKVPAGTWILRYNVWNNSDYDVGDEVTVTIGDSETVDGVVVTLIPANSSISGRLVDASGNAITDVSASIYADNGSGSNKYAWTNDGSYSFKVSGGEWTLGAWVSWGSGYIVSPQQEKTVTVGDDEDVTFDITVVKEDSLVSGTVTDESGTPLQNMWISLKTKKGEETTSNYDAYRSYYEFGAVSDQNGNYEIQTTSGDWFVTPSATAGSGYMNPEAVKVTVDSSHPADVDFVFRVPDATISGNVTLDGAESPASVYAWSEDGGYTSTTSDSGTFELPITSDDTWNVGAVHEVDNENTFYEASEVVIIAEEENTTYTADLSLTQSDLVVPDAETVTFNSDEMATLELSDGTQVVIPEFAISDDTDQLLTVTATPLVEGVARTSTEQPLGLMYDLQAVKADGEDVGSEITSFAAEVTIVLPYTDDQLEKEGITEEEITPSYWDDTNRDYRSVNNVVVNTDENEISCTINHFTKFGIVTSGTADATLTIPAVSLTLPPDGSTVSVPQVLVQGTTSDAASTVSVSLNGSVVGTPTVSSDGSFEHTVTDLTLGSNTLSVSATNGAGSSEAVTRTLTYAIGTEADGGDGNGDNGGGDGDDTPLPVATAVVKDVIVVPNEGASNIRMLTNTGEYIRSFYAYSPTVRGSYQMLTRDLDGDGEQELLVSTEDGLTPHVRLFDKEGNLLTHFFPFGTGARFGAKMLLADVTGDGLPELFTWPEGRAGAQLRVYSYDADEQSFSLTADDFVYAETFRGTINVTVADVTGDDTPDVIVFPTSGGTSHIRVFNYENGKLELLTQFFAYGTTVRVGLRVMTGDLDGDGVRDLVVAPEEAAGSNIRFYKFNTNDEAFELLGWTMAFGPQWRGELNIRVGDIDNDGMIEAVVAPHTQGGPNVQVFEYNALTQEIDRVGWFMAYQESYHGGVDFAITNLDNDNYREIVTSPRHDGGSNLRVYEYDPDQGGFVLSDWMLVYGAGLRGQLHVTVSDIQGDGDSELIISPLEVGMGGPNVRVLDWNSDTEELELYGWFWGFAENFRGGVKATTINE
ncbi:MAG: carboxypeptidase regulatory-like domain-containing protein [Candidatus Kerfeldbacteria bacterium]|nr:carboxypeptidase regulatory-like domain-containing protein [Candidatus Kerfeldbacteria bacterium]